jgi:hypothetical protein
MLLVPDELFEDAMIAATAHVINHCLPDMVE